MCYLRKIEVDLEGSANGDTPFSIWRAGRSSFSSLSKLTESFEIVKQSSESRRFSNDNSSPVVSLVAPFNAARHHWNILTKSRGRFCLITIP